MAEMPCFNNGDFAEVSMNITFNGIWRMDWGFGNPNLTAALMITLLCVAWLPAFCFRRGFWFSLPAATAIGVCLVHTMSRGGILGGIIAMAVLAAFAPRPWPIKRLIGAGSAVWIAICAAFFLNAHQRISQGIATEDKSITHRLQIWKAAPAMLAVRPDGWGLNEAGRAYADWFQPVGRTENYGSLVNTHLTKVVELGIIGGAGYLFLWLLSLVLCWPSSHSRWRAVLFAMLLGFGVAATFTNMARNWELWILPAAAIVAAIVDRICRRQNLPLPFVLATLFLSIIPPVTLYFMGRDQSPLSIQADQKIVTIGSGDPSLWILADSTLLGDNFRRKLREYVSSNPDLSIYLVERLEHLPKSVNEPIFIAANVNADQAKAIADRSQQTMILSPQFSPADLGDSKSLVAIFGELSKSRHLAEWLEVSNTIKLQGIGDFIPEWPKTLLELTPIENL